MPSPVEAPSDYLSTAITFLPGIGERKSKVLQEELEVYTFRDLLHVYPYRYIDRSKIYTIRELQPKGVEVQLKGVIQGYTVEGFGAKARVKASFTDGTGSIELVWFNSSYVIDQYPAGGEYIIFGKPKRYKHVYTISHPDVTPVSRSSLVLGGLLSVYHSSDRMKKASLDSRRLRMAMARLCQVVQTYIQDPFSPALCARLGLMPLGAALYAIHFPKDIATLEAAQYRLKFDELFYLQLSMQWVKEQRKARFKGHLFRSVGEFFHGLYEQLPFDLTQAQKRVLREIRYDTQLGTQMNRLIQGDVGCGKTLVAALAMMLALDNATQACLMAPTEILAQQHFETLWELLSPLGIRLALLTGSTTAKEREKTLSALQNGELQILIGTHALLEERVQFARLGLAVIDEQHRFGVMQRARLWEKSLTLLPHVLIMSATPIPRTLAMTMYGDLDISIIDELPPGRKPIVTKHYYNDSAEVLYQFIEKELFAGRQIYVVYPMIQGSEDSDYKNLETGYQQYIYRFGERNVTWVHGKLKAQEKQERMNLFSSGKVPILLSTTVIEVGVNVPNASVMVIENADRFGLAQLHQLRGRVGRGSSQSYCILLSKRAISQVAVKRIEAMCRSNDGFYIAEEDLKLRGAGDIEGTRQSGELKGLKLAEPSKDLALVYKASSLIQQLVQKSPSLEDFPSIARELERRYPKDQLWGNIG